MLAFVCTLALTADPSASMPSVIVVPEAARASDHFDVTAATDAYLQQIPPAASDRSDAYFEGGYWLQLWDFLFGAAMALLLLNWRWSARMRDLAARMSKRPSLQTAIYWVQYSLLTTLLGFPLGLYEGYFREHQYGLATQSIGPWLVDQLKGTAVGLVIGAIAVTGLFAIVRKLERTWWIWGSVAATLFMILMVIVAPVYLVPIFNTSKPLQDLRVKDSILWLAHASGVPADDVYEIDASKQSNRMSANVSGFGSTMRITLNDNLLKRASPEEIEMVMGHEIGHYVLNHILKDILFFFIVIVIGFSLLRWSLARFVARYGQRWGISGVTDVAVLPLVMLVISTFFFVLTPIQNSWVRMQEAEADRYGVNTSRQPDGAAQAAIHLAEYRKMNPGTLEEIIFFDHPSGRHRIFAAMQWKAQNLELFVNEKRQMQGD